ncbi:MAG: DUF6293 family protein [Candidatus Nanoarchaeia archaeon]|jgi:DNA-binding transcriptional ArsR family regulator|nr:DUF6293 family protein [Candidatus Nanoarchaeia archaeon]|tara:strand:+ start:14203 stop:14835 length:633 start_codon:yes stop_codon:yes gene_type:complete
MKNVIIAPVGDNMDALFVGIKDFPTERIILLSPKNRLDEAEKAKSDLEKFQIPTKIMEIEGNVWEEMFSKIAQIKNLEKDNEIIVNTATGDRTTTCAATSAAFVNGLKAISVEGSETMLLPVLKFSYYKILTDKKLDILKLLNDENCCASLEELSKRTKMSLPLVSYHINGTLKSDGLKELGLIETLEKKGKIDVKLTTLGRLLVKGYIN